MQTNSPIYEISQNSRVRKQTCFDKPAKGATSQTTIPIRNGECACGRNIKRGVKYKQKALISYSLTRAYPSTRSGNQELNPCTTQIKHNTLTHIFINVNLLHYIV